VGIGIRTGQLTFEGQKAIENADTVFALVADAIAMEMLKSYNKHIVDLASSYSMGKERHLSYAEMADRVLFAVREGQRVCLAVYGNPAVFVSSSRQAINIARAEGYDVEMLPGISAEDSMFCDLEIDPAEHGCQIYCATQFVAQNRSFDPYAILTLWQVAIIGESRLMAEGDSEYRDALSDKLEAVYGLVHPAILYEAATNPFFPPDMRLIAMSDLRTARVRPCCTVVIPPIDRPDLVKVELSTQETVWAVWPSGPPA